MRTGAALPSFGHATRSYETWIGAQCAVVRRDLERKHRRITKSRFDFFRGTFYRWAQRWPIVCRNLSDAPRALAVGDLHAANFGTWRDCDDRLVWGVNDFDEAFELPYTQDLVRLASSVLVAVGEDYLALGGKAACRTIVEGYAASLATGGEPIVLAERHRKLRAALYLKRRDDPVRFWRDAAGLPPVRAKVPPLVDEGFKAVLPRGASYRVFTRGGGVGSLGRPRYVAIGEWQGGCVGCEAKAVVRSAWAWAVGESPRGRIFADHLQGLAVRSPDPHLHLSARWLFRRFGPESGRLELKDDVGPDTSRLLLHAMGWEAANVHLGSAAARAPILRDLANRRSDWLFAAATRMKQTVESDWDAWRSLR